MLFELSNFDCVEKIEEVVPRIIYYYLFEGLTLTAIEEKLFNSKDLNGWLCKSILNFYSIDTSVISKNRGMYKGESVESVIYDLRKSGNIHHNVVAAILSSKYFY